MAGKARLDALLVERGLSPSRERAKSVIMSGKVYVNGQKSDKPGHEIDSGADIEVRGDEVGFVSRGGLKLEKALDEFDIAPAGRLALDCGASTGGFTDCLLRAGASHVWAIDVGYGQLAWALRNDGRVTVMERFNVRNLTKEHINAPVDLAVADLSFISLRLVLPVIARVLEEGCDIVCLVKPQFEAGKGMVGKNGVVRDRAVHVSVLERMCAFVGETGLSVKGLTFSPVKGPKGNIEFLLHAVRGDAGRAVDIEKTVDSAHDELKGYGCE